MELNGGKFGNNYVRIYTTGLSLWVPSFELVDLAHDGNWKLLHDDKRTLCWDSKTSRLIVAEDDDYWDIVNIYFPKGNWKIR